MKTIETPQTELDAEAERAEAMENHRTQLAKLGNLSPTEIERLVRFEHVEGPLSVGAQIDRYYLQIKSSKPDAAQKMLTEALPLYKTVMTEEDLEKLCFALRRHLSGFLIRYGDHCYSIDGGSFSKS